MAARNAGRVVKVLSGHRKRQALFLFVLLLLVLLSIGWLSGRQGEPTVATVNGVPVSEQEFKLFLQDNTANTYNYFKQRYNVDNHPGFWTGTFGGEVPIEYARKQALDQLVRIKIEQSLAKKNGIMKDIRYSAFLRSLTEENKQRKEKLINNQVIYGPEQYNELDYFRYVHSNMLVQLKQKLAQGELRVSNPEIDGYYNANHALFKKNNEVTVQIVIGTAGKESSAGKAANQSAVQASLAKLKDQADHGVDLMDAVKAENATGRINLTIVEKTFGDLSSRTDSMEYPESAKKAQLLHQGETSDIFQENGYSAFLRCVGSTDMGYQSLADAEGYIKTLLSDKKYSDLLDKLIESAKVEVVRKTYNRIMVD
jgi:hypothetical protein